MDELHDGRHLRVLRPASARRQLAAAALVAGTLGGAPSTIHAVVTGRPLRRTVEAAGELIGRPTVLGGALAHAVMTTWWTAALLGLVRRRRRPVVWGAAGGLVIAGLDLTIADLRYPRIAALPRVPQWLDHVAFGALVGAVAARRGRLRRCRPASASANPPHPSPTSTP